jgi:hypothetical protein
MWSRALEAVVVLCLVLAIVFAISSLRIREVFGPPSASDRSRLHRQLVEEGLKVGVTTVRSYLRERRRRSAEVFVPLVHRFCEKQVDFFEVTVDVGAERRKVWKYLLRLMYSGREFVWCTTVAISGLPRRPCAGVQQARLGHDTAGLRQSVGGGQTPGRR